jgi:hypothetical protein
MISRLLYGAVVVLALGCASMSDEERARAARVRVVNNTDAVRRMRRSVSGGRAPVLKRRSWSPGGTEILRNVAPVTSIGMLSRRSS